MGEGSIIGEKTAEKVTKKLSEKAMASVAKSFSRDSSSDSGFSTKDFLNSMKDFFDKSGQNSNSTSNTKDTGDSGEGGSEDREERKEREETREEDKEDNEEREEREKREGRDKRKRHISDLKDKFTLNKLENKKDKIETKDATQTWNTVAFIITLGVILIDLFQFGFNRNKQTIAGVLLLYGLYIIFFFLKTMFIDYEGDFGESIKNFKLPLILTILQIVIPYMALEFIPLILPKVAGLIFGILLMFSPWLVYYIFLIPPDSSGRIITFFRVAWVLFLLGLIFLMTLPILTESLTNVASTKTVNLNPTVALNDFGGAIKDQIAKMKGLLNSTKDEFTYNKKGQIDKNVNSRLGVFIEELKTIPGIITENNDFFLLGELRVNTLFNEIAITSNCYLEKNSNDKSPKTGEMDENYYLTYGKSIELIECNMSGVDAGI